MILGVLLAVALYTCIPGGTISVTVYAVGLVGKLTLQRSSPPGCTKAALPVLAKPELGAGGVVGQAASIPAGTVTSGAVEVLAMPPVSAMATLLSVAGGAALPQLGNFTCTLTIPVEPAAKLSAGTPSGYLSNGVAKRHVRVLPANVTPATLPPIGE